MTYQEELNKQYNLNTDCSYCVATARRIYLYKLPTVYNDSYLKIDKNKILLKLIFLDQETIDKASDHEMIRASSICQLATGMAKEYFFELMKQKKNGE